MRVTGGRARGTRLRTPSKRSVRPTTSLAKRAIFSLLESSGAGWSRVLDLYAGTGALGIEALSRNAEWVDFVDQRKSCCDIIRANLRSIGESQRAHVYCCSVTRALSFLENHYDIIFIDPPYSDLSIKDLMSDVGRSELPGEDCTVVVSHSHRVPLEPVYDALHLVKQRRYGDTCISIYTKEV